MRDKDDRIWRRFVPGPDDQKTESFLPGGGNSGTTEPAQRVIFTQAAHGTHDIYNRTDRVGEAVAASHFNPFGPDFEGDEFRIYDRSGQQVALTRRDYSFGGDENSFEVIDTSGRPLGSIRPKGPGIWFNNDGAYEVFDAEGNALGQIYREPATPLESDREPEWLDSARSRPGEDVADDVLSLLGSVLKVVFFIYMFAFGWVFRFVRFNWRGVLTAWLSLAAAFAIVGRMLPAAIPVAAGLGITTEAITNPRVDPRRPRWIASAVGVGAFGVVLGLAPSLVEDSTSGIQAGAASATTTAASLKSPPPSPAAATPATNPSVVAPDAPATSVPSPAPTVAETPESTAAPTTTVLATTTTTTPIPNMSFRLTTFPYSGVEPNTVHEVVVETVNLSNFTAVGVEVAVELSPGVVFADDPAANFDLVSRREFPVGEVAANGGTVTVPFRVHVGAPRPDETPPFANRPITVSVLSQRNVAIEVVSSFDVYLGD